MMRLVALLATVLLAVACSPHDRRLASGVGTDLPWAGLPEATRAQEDYVALICRQAGALDVAGAGCVDWTTFVQAGMNDIDERCDAYLAWLDDRRRSTGPVLQQISDVRTATIAIMSASGTGVTPISIAAAAFGLASSTFSNLNSRLLLELPHSTVQAVVLGKQRDFRLGLARQRVENRPAAIHALRSYLRLCMPFTIETEITTTVTLYERGGPAALADRAPLVSPSTAGVPVAPLRAVAPLPATPAPVTVLAGATSLPERNLDRADLLKIQGLICAVPTGRFDDDTRRNIRIYQQYRGAGDSNGELRQRDVRELLRTFGTLKGCDRRKHLNYFERVRYGTPEVVLKLQGELNKRADGGTIPLSGELDEATRRKIESVRAVTAGVSKDRDVRRQVTPEFSQVVDLSD